MRTVLLIVLLLCTTAFSQIQKQLTFEEENSLGFECFHFLIFRDENNARWYVFSAIVDADSCDARNYKVLKPKGKYVLDLFKVENKNMPYCKVQGADEIYIYDKLSIKDHNPVEDFYFTSSLVDHYYIECIK
ncbi:MAG: hypothetical protein Q8903_08415 [Bacteroidota bacterium]|nr:hypothetical protein [Bacteroidota bacterium]